MDDAQIIAEARGWIADCEWADDFDVNDLTEDQVMMGIAGFYGGGWRQFVADCQ